jgi:hypothetical protein
VRSTTCRTPFNKTIFEDYRIVNAPTVDASHILEIHLTDIVDETSPGLAHQESTASCTRHKSSSSALFPSSGSGNKRASLSHPEPSAEWKLTKIAQFQDINEIGNMKCPARVSRSKGIVQDDIEEETVIS